ncbi:MAG: hypothetical protein AB1489_11515 [Acidobacteriota bacterium]
MQDNTLPSFESVFDVKRHEEKLIVRIHQLSHILSDSRLSLEEEAQIKLILEDALAELDAFNEKSNAQKRQKRQLFH